MSKTSTARMAPRPTEEARRLVLDEGALLTGDRWSAMWRAALIADGRRVQGGFPGTLAEAKAQVRAYFGPELARRRMAALSADEMQSAVAATRARARHDWDLHAEREPPEPRGLNENDRDPRCDPDRPCRAGALPRRAHSPRGLYVALPV